MVGAATLESKSFWHLTMVWLALTVTLIFGHMTLWAQSAAGTEFRLAGVEVFGPITERPLNPSNLPEPTGPSVHYAGLRWSLTESRTVPLSNPETDYPIIVLELVVANTTVDTPLRVRKGDLAIVWPDGRRDEVDRFEHLPSSIGFRVDPGGTLAVTAVFKPRVVAEPDLATMALEIGEEGRIPAVLPLDGPAEPSPFPVVGSIEGDPLIASDPLQPGRWSSISAVAASIDVDAGPYRAAVGDRLLLVTAIADQPTTGATAADPDHLEPGFWALDAGAVIVRPIEISPTAVDPIDPARSTTEIVLVFVVEPGFTAGELTIDADGPEPTRYGVEIPAAVGKSS